MDSSRRAVESYWRSRLIDAATSDEDKVAPVYKLEEICELLRSSHVGIVKEVSEFVLKRLDHKSPIVKQKALRLIKYAVGKSGVEFRREMQRNSVVVRQLLHYKGQVDPLKGDSLNKAVRDTAQETISAIFSAEDNKTAALSENLAKRIEGFGNTNFEMQSDDKKSFLSEVVGIGSASIKQGLSSFAQAHSARKDDNGSYKGPNLRRSLTTEIDYPDGYESVEHPNDNQGSFGISKNVAGGPLVQDLRVSKTEPSNVNSSSSHTESKTREERLLETIVTSGGVRLQPTRDAIQIFLVEAAKLNSLPLSHAIESKLQSHLWQVRMKAICVLESILRKKDEEKFVIVASYFSENKDVVVKCSESPQASLKEKANKVFSLLGGGQASNLSSHVEKPVKAETATVVQMPDLIDTAYPDDYSETENSATKQSEPSVPDLVTSIPPLIDDLFGDDIGSGEDTSEQKIDDDPFADVLFHTSEEGRQHSDDLFSGMTVDDKPSANGNGINVAANKNGTELFDIFASNPELLQELSSHKNVSDVMAGLSINENNLKQKGTSSGLLLETIFSDSIVLPGNQVSNDPANGSLGSQVVGPIPNVTFPLGSMPNNITPPIMFNPTFLSHPINYGAMGNFLAQQQFLATMPNFQQLGNLSSQGVSVGVGHAAGTGGYSSSLPDIFHPNVPTHTANTVMSSPKKEETKAFDFISDHLAAARDPKRVV